MIDMYENRRNFLQLLVNRYESQPELAHVLNVSTSYVNQLLLGKRPITEKTASKFEQKLRLPEGSFDKFDSTDASSVMELLDNAGQKAIALKSKTGHKTPTSNTKILVLNAEQAKNWKDFVYTNNEKAEGEMVIVSDLAITPASFAFVVKGDSMEPEFFEGEYVVVDPLQDHNHESYVLAEVAGDIVIRQVWREAGDWLLKPVNKQYSTKNLSDSHIIGCIRYAMPAPTIRTYP